MSFTPVYIYIKDKPKITKKRVKFYYPTDEEDKKIKEWRSKQTGLD